jgi:RecA-family ATPase
MQEEKKVETATESSLLPLTLTDVDISSTDFPEPRFVVPGLVPEGITILGGKPKIGKSLLGYNLAVSLATGQNVLGTIPVDQIEVLYLCLEETPGRLKRKLAKIRGDSLPTNRIHFAFRWPRIQDGGLEDLDRWVKEHPMVKIVFIDTLARIRSLNGSQGGYATDYDEIGAIKSVADRNSVAIVVIHHLRKASAEDQIDLITGSAGLTGAADSILILRRQRMSSESVLFVAGRDIEEKTFALRFDRPTCSWAMIGLAEEYRMSKERQEVVQLLRGSQGSIKLKDIASALGKKEPVVHKHLSSLVEAGLVEQPGYGLYQIHENDKSGESGETGESLLALQ